MAGSCNCRFCPALDCRFRFAPRLVAETSLNRSPITHTNLPLVTDFEKYPKRISMCHHLDLQKTTKMMSLHIDSEIKRRNHRRGHQELNCISRSPEKIYRRRIDWRVFVRRDRNSIDICVDESQKILTFDRSLCICDSRQNRGTRDACGSSAKDVSQSYLMLCEALIGIFDLRVQNRQAPLVLRLRQ